MSFSVGGRELPVYQGDTNQALQAIGQAYGAVNDSYDKLARLPGMAKNMVQDDADARYTAALNKYSNDPNGLAQALANGEIDTSNVRAETLGKTQDTLSNIQKTQVLGYAQGRQENLDKFMDNPENAKAYFNAKQAALKGDQAGVDAYLAGVNGPSEMWKYWKDLDAQGQLNTLADQAIRRQQIAAGLESLNFDKYKYNTELDAMAAVQEIMNYGIARGFGSNPEYDQSFGVNLVNGGFEDWDSKATYARVLKSAAAVRALNDWMATALYKAKGQSPTAPNKDEQAQTANEKLRNLKQN